MENYFLFSERQGNTTTSKTKQPVIKQEQLVGGKQDRPRNVCEFEDHPISTRGTDGEKLRCQPEPTGSVFGEEAQMRSRGSDGGQWGPDVREGHLSKAMWLSAPDHQVTQAQPSVNTTLAHQGDS